MPAVLLLEEEAVVVVLRGKAVVVVLMRGEAVVALMKEEAGAVTLKEEAVVEKLANSRKNARAMRPITGSGERYAQTAGRVVLVKVQMNEIRLLNMSTIYNNSV